MRRRRGYLLAEVILGLMLIGVIMTSLVIGIVRQNRASAALAETRALVAAAESAMTRLQSGSIPDPPAGAQVTVARLEHEPIGQRVWVELTMEQGPRSFSLRGLVSKLSWDKWQQSHPASKVSSRVSGEGKP